MPFFNVPVFPVTDNTFAQKQSPQNARIIVGIDIYWCRV
jgi:hypothetical protein